MQVNARQEHIREVHSFMKTLVMVVDDEPEMLRSLTRLLENQGYEVLPFSHPGEAVEQARTRTPAVVLTDVNMPEMTGYDVTHSILSIARGTQVVVMTADIRAITALDAYQAGASDYLNKPVDNLELQHILGLACERYSRWRKVVQATLKPQLGPSPAPPLPLVSSEVQ
jgi:two-component system, NtrC family, C4-dicarboxylate transport response regulator DctD